MKKYLLALFFVVVVITTSACSQTPRCPTANQSPSILAPNEYNPAEFLPILCQISEPFADFYEAEIEPLNVTVRWFNNPKMSPDEFAYITLSEDGHSGNVSLRDKPQYKKDVYAIAHELATFVVKSEGFCSMWSKGTEPWQRAKISLFDMLSTPLRDSILADYNINVKDTFDLQEELLLNLACNESEHWLITHQHSWTYVTFVLYWQNVLNNHGVPPSIDDWYKDCRPTAHKEGTEILDMVDELGYSPPDKAIVLFQRIIDEYNLGCCLGVY